MTMGLKMLNEMIKNVKFYGDKYGIGYSEGILTSTSGSTKFVKASNEERKLYSSTISSRGKPIVLSQPDYQGKPFI